MYCAPRLQVIPKQQTNGYWHGFGYYKTAWDRVSGMLMSEKRTVLSSRASDPLSERRSRASSFNSFKTGDEEDEGLADLYKLSLDKKDKNDETVFEFVNAFEEHFFTDIR
jgi:hypothetical protein